MYLCSVVSCCYLVVRCFFFFFFSSRRRHTRSDRDWSSDVCSSDLHAAERQQPPREGEEVGILVAAPRHPALLAVGGVGVREAVLGAPALVALGEHRDRKSVV